MFADDANPWSPVPARCTTDSEFGWVFRTECAKDGQPSDADDAGASFTFDVSPQLEDRHMDANEPAAVSPPAFSSALAEAPSSTDTSDGSKACVGSVPDAADDDTPVAHSCNITVSGLPRAVDSPTLKKAFLRYGKVLSAMVMLDTHSGRSRGFGFVWFPTEDEAKAAVTGTHCKKSADVFTLPAPTDGSEIPNSKLRVVAARPSDMPLSNSVLFTNWPNALSDEDCRTIMAEYGCATRVQFGDVSTARKHPVRELRVTFTSSDATRALITAVHGVLELHVGDRKVPLPQPLVTKLGAPLPTRRPLPGRATPSPPPQSAPPQQQRREPLQVQVGATHPAPPGPHGAPWYAPQMPCHPHVQQLSQHAYGGAPVMFAPQMMTAHSGYATATPQQYYYVSPPHFMRPQ